MFSKPADLVREMGISDQLAADLEVWAIAWETKSGTPEHDAEAAALIRRLKKELNHRYQIVYHP